MLLVGPTVAGGRMRGRVGVVQMAVTGGPVGMGGPVQGRLMGLRLAHTQVSPGTC